MPDGVPDSRLPDRVPDADMPDGLSDRLPDGMPNGVPDGLSDGLPVHLHNGGVPMTQRIPTLQMVCISDSRQCNAGCSYCPSRGLPVKDRLPLPDLRRLVDYFVGNSAVGINRCSCHVFLP